MLNACGRARRLRSHENRAITLIPTRPHRLQWRLMDRPTLVVTVNTTAAVVSALFQFVMLLHLRARLDRIIAQCDRLIARMDGLLRTYRLPNGDRL